MNASDRALRELVVAGVTVESCPTSNLVVADLDEPPLGALLQQKDLRVTVCTDDAGLFSAWPGRELEWAQRYQARERVLKAGRDASFVRVRVP